MKKVIWVLIAVMVLSLTLTGISCKTNTAASETTATITTATGSETVAETTAAEKIVEEAKKEGAYVIGYAAPALYGGQTMIQEGMVIGCEQNGMAIVTINSYDDAKKQVEAYDYFINIGVDAIVAVPIDSAAIGAGIKKANDAGIPCFTIDRDPIGTKLIMVIQADNYGAGSQMAEVMVDKLTKKYGSAKGLVLEIQGDLAGNEAVARGAGFNDFMKDYPDIKIIQKPTKWERDKFASIAIDVATANPELDGIYVHSECVGTSIVPALESIKKLYDINDPKHIFLVGVDGCPEGLGYVREGLWDAVASQPLPDYGIVMGKVIKDYLDGKGLPKGQIIDPNALWSPADVTETEFYTRVLLKTAVVTKENVDDERLWANTPLAMQ
jgi:ABC-type sugar transport system substrate-binding protein